MAPRRKPPKKAEVDISQQLAEALAQKPQRESHETHEAPIVGDTVRIGSSDTEYRVSYVSPNGREVNLELPGTNLERYRVSVDDLNISGRAARKAKEAPKPSIDAEAVRERIEEAGHSIIEHLNEEVSALKKFLRSKGVSAGEALDEFTEATEASWKATIDVIQATLEP